MKTNKPAASKGRAHISQKSSSFNIDEMNELREQTEGFQLDPALKKELEDKGLAYRWINSSTYQKNFGHHRSGWRVYKRDEPGKKGGSLDFAQGTDPEGYVRRGDMVLATKPVADQEKHRRSIARKSQIFQGINQQKADELRAMARESGTDMSILDGYDGDDEVEE